MSYRKLTIEDRTYEYVIGKKFTKVKVDGKAFGLYKNSEHGNQVGYPCLDGTASLYDEYVVTPENVRRMILQLPLPCWSTPNGGTTYLMIDPYDLEIYQKTTYVPLSIANYNLSADEI